VEPISTALLAALIIAARGGADEVGKESVRTTWRGAPKLVALVKGKLGGDRHASRALVQAQNNPQDEQAVTELSRLISDYRNVDPAFRAELDKLIREARRDPSYGNGSAFLSNYGWIGKVTVFNAAVTLEQGDFNIN
jgi:hypothetical protein